MAAPSKYTEEVVTAICNYAAKGISLVNCAKLAGINPDTLFDWKKTKPEFSERLARATSICEEEMLEMIRKAAPKDWKAAAWLLERRFRNDWGQKVAVEHSFDPSMVDWQRVPDDKLDQALRGDVMVLDEYRKAS